MFCTILPAVFATVFPTLMSVFPEFLITVDPVLSALPASFAPVFRTAF